MFKVGFKTVVKVKDWAQEFDKERRKHQSFALTHAAVWLTKKSRDDLKTGRLGLKRLSYMSDRSDKRFGQKRRGRKGLRSRMKMDRAPLTGLWRGITYFVNKRSGSAVVGFRGIGGTKWQARLADKAFKAYRWQYTAGMRAGLHKAGIHLKPGTTAARVPARDIMGMVMRKYEAGFFRHYDKIFGLKMQGKRVEFIKL